MIAASVVLVPTRGGAAEPTTDDLMVWAAERYRELSPRIEDVEPRTIETFVDLDALADDESWRCDPDDEGGCVRTFGRATLGGDVEELRLVGVEEDGGCYWRVLVKVAEGWLPSHELGVSPDRCRGPIAAAEKPADSRWWFPIHMAERGSIVRIEGQGVSEGKVERSAVLCRVVPGGLGCSERREPTTIAPSGRTLRPKPSLFPTSAASAIGVRDRAAWFARPTRGGSPPVPGAVYGDGEASRVWRIPLGPEGPEVVVIDAFGTQVLLERNGRTLPLGELGPSVLNEASAVLGVDPSAAPGVVRVSMELQNVSETRVSWRKDVLVRLVPGGSGRVQVVSVATSCEARTSTLHWGWARDVVVTPVGLRLVERDGPLAWFRSVGEFEWADLAATFARDQRAMARALRDANAPDELARLANEAIIDMRHALGAGVVDVPFTLTFTNRGPMTSVPGYLEPVRHAVFDIVREL